MKEPIRQTPHVDGIYSTERSEAMKMVAKRLGIHIERTIPQTLPYPLGDGKTKVVPIDHVYVSIVHDGSLELFWREVDSIAPKKVYPTARINHPA